MCTPEGTSLSQHYYLLPHLWKLCQKDWAMPVSLLPLTVGDD